MPAVILTVMILIEPKLGGILLSICTILVFLFYILLLIGFGGEFHLFDRIPLTLLTYFVISILLIVFSRKKKENETESGGIRC